MTMTVRKETKTWLITGASQGLGLAMAKAALKAGHKVIACARDPDSAAQAHPEVEASGGQWMKLDVSSRQTQDIVKNVVDQMGGIDVVVNNAGIFSAGTVEELEEDEMHAAMDTNFWGPVRVLKGVLPSMRARRSGTIVSISSIFGFYPCPGGVMYCCSKAAHDMLQTVLGTELAPFNIRTVTITAGLYRTDVLKHSTHPSKGFSETSLTSNIGQVLGHVGEMVQNPEQHMPGDPAKFGERVVEIVDGTGLGGKLGQNSRFLFGRDALKLSSSRMQELTDSFKASEEIANSTDFEGHTGEGAANVAEYIGRGQ